jgi:protein-S-isoprenylcysteine O-methyltransferase Ste14
LGEIIVMAAGAGRYNHYDGGNKKVFLFAQRHQPPVALELGGLNRYVRHPLYFGTLLFVWGLFFVFPFLNSLLACIVITLYTVLGAVLEEKKLIKQFGEQYVLYKEQVPMLVPGLF